jgi:hypothetical protein
MSDRFQYCWLGCVLLAKLCGQEGVSWIENCSMVVEYIPTFAHYSQTVTGSGGGCTASTTYEIHQPRF